MPVPATRASIARAWKFLRSLQFGVALLLALALLGVVGSVGRLEPWGRGTLARWLGLADTFRSPAFLAVIAALLASVVACTVQRLAARGVRGPAGVADAVMHGAIVLVIAGGAVRATAGFTAAENVRVGAATAAAFDWSAGRSRDLGVVLRVEELARELYPARLRIGVQDAATGRKVGLVELAAGQERPVAGRGDLTVRVLEADPGKRLARCAVLTPDGPAEVALELREGPGASVERGGYRFTVVAWREDLRMVRALVSARGLDGFAVEGWVSPREQLHVGRLRISLTAWGEDEVGEYAGLQVSEDPGRLLFWAGSVLFALALATRAALRVRRPGTVGALAVALLATAAPVGAADPAGAADERTGIELVAIPGGEYEMGSADGYDNEQPVHREVVKGFRLAKTEVTRGQFRRFVAATGYVTDAEKGDRCVAIREDETWSIGLKRTWLAPGFPQTDDHPVVCVSWNDAQAFAAWAGMRLPTEAEWEYAAGGGARHFAYAWGDPAPDRPPAGNVADDALGKLHPHVTRFKDHDDGFAYTAPPCTFPPNAFGLCDMTGNVWEWVENWYVVTYEVDERNAPHEYRVVRGGGWDANPVSARITHRGSLSPGGSLDAAGFRLAAP